MKVTLKDIKGIKKLEFSIPYSPGVKVLTGRNGSGKTTLFVALSRIKNKSAFYSFYKSGSIGSRADEYDKAQIEYTFENQSVIYRKRPGQWAPTPKKNSKLLQSFPFSSVKFINADPSRIVPYPEEVIPRKLYDAHDEIKKIMRVVFNESKWNALKYTEITRKGRGANLRAYLLKSGNTYYSERSFSLGELCVLKLAIQLRQSQNGDLVLIDEVEMALYPEAQVRLLHQIEDIALSRGLTVLFSTHSATLMKAAGRDRLLFLREEPDNKGDFAVIEKPYLAQVLGELAVDYESTIDYVFYVEDGMAKALLLALILCYINVQAIPPEKMPNFRVVPVGGYQQVVEMLDNSSSILPSSAKRYAFLDGDVKSREDFKSHEEFSNFREAKFDLGSNNKVKRLPCTPELGLTEYLEQLNAGQDSRLDSFCLCIKGYRGNIRGVLNSDDYKNSPGANDRKKAKAKLKVVVDIFAKSSGESEESILRDFFEIFIRDKYSEKEYICRTFGPIFKS